MTKWNIYNQKIKTFHMLHVDLVEDCIICCYGSVRKTLVCGLEIMLNSGDLNYNALDVLCTPSS